MSQVSALVEPARSLSPTVLVQKYGGTSLASVERVGAVADRVARIRRSSPRMVIVGACNAMASSGAVMVSPVLSSMSISRGGGSSLS